jgi:hypothetical protein
VLAIACSIAALACACLAVRTPEAGAPASCSAGEGIVFGRVRVFELGYEIDPWKRELSEIIAEKPVIELALFHVDSGRKRPDVPIAAEGRFEWILPAGTYLVYHTPSVDPPCNEPLAAFQVADGSDPLDLGELRLSVSVDRPLSWELATYTLAGIDTREASAETNAWFRQRHPGTSSVRSGAFATDPELGGLFGNWSREQCARVLARHGLVVGGAEVR